MRIARSRPRLEKLGVKAGDVIVAVDGRRVRDRAQFDCLRELSKGEEVKVIVWHEGRYDEIIGPLARPHPAVRLESLRSPE